MNIGEKLWRDLTALQNFQINLARNEMNKPLLLDDEEIVPREESWSEHDLSRKEIEYEEKQYPNK